jgi:CheY-like chemotaxis protein
MDWKMPNMDGIETACQIKLNDDLTPLSAILMVTSYGMDEVRQAA